MGRTYRPEDYIWLGLVLSFVHLLFAAIARSPAGLTSELTELGGGGGREGLHSGEGKEGVSGTWVLMTLIGGQALQYFQLRVFSSP